MPLASSTVMTPSLPTFCIASAIISPISASPLAEIVPTCAVSACVVICLAALLQFLDQCDNRLVNATLHVHRVHAGRDCSAALVHDGLGQHDGGSRAITGDIVGLRCGLAHHLRTHVLELVGEFDLPGDGHTILGDPRCTIALVQDHIAALRTERYVHRLGKYVDAAHHALTGIIAEPNVFRCHLSDLS